MVKAGCLLLLWTALALLAPPAGAQCGGFRRGDSNGDGRIDIGDAIATLNFLFAGGQDSGCDDALDADDSGSVDITDPVFTLNFLFLGGSPVPPPGPSACGEDPTEDRLTCSFPQGCKPPPVPLDESGFARFRYSQAPGLGFCPEVEEVFAAVIEEQGDGSYRLEYSVLEEGPPGGPRCIPEIISGECWVEVPQPPRLLEASEAERVRSTFANLEVNLSRDPICECIAFDPCRIRRFEWDGRLATDFLCSAPYLDPATIVDLLESLRRDP